MPTLPPPDPHESPHERTLGGPLPAATAVFAHGTSSPEAQRLAERFLELRPGLLLIVGAG